jgi:inward rectifier potassium channel
MSAPNTRRFRNIDNTGFGPNSNVEGGRLVNADGSTNLKKRGLPIWERISIFHTLLRMKRSHFFLIIFVSYTAINLVFASIYYIIGVNNLIGIDGAHTFFERFTAAFFFSSQTLTTVGYGHVAPTGMATNVAASIESLLGILAFAVVTGIMYGRFSRPRAYLMFSDNLLVAPYKEGRALMLRTATYKNNYLADVQAELTVALHVNEHGKKVTRFYQLPLEFPKINSLALSWTIVHHINEDSPLFNYTKQQMDESRMEVIVGIRAFDDHFSNIVQQRTSYTHHQLVYGGKFLPMFERGNGGDYTVLELDKINTHEIVTLPEHVHKSIEA